LNDSFLELFWALILGYQKERLVPKKKDDYQQAERH